MEELIIQSRFRLYKNKTELSAEAQQLFEKAREVLKKAHAPYSRFKVGAAVALQNGDIICGNNQENAAYPSGLCAERVALFYAAAQYPDQKIKSILVIAESEKGDLNCRVSPCGACRQSIAEYEQKQGSGIEIIFMHDAEAFLSCQSIKDLLPLGFDSDSLENKK